MEPAKSAFSRYTHPLKSAILPRYWHSRRLTSAAYTHPLRSAWSRYTHPLKSACRP